MYQKISYILFFLTALALPVRGQETFEKEIDIGTTCFGTSIIPMSDGGFLIGGYTIIPNVNQATLYKASVVKVNSLGIAQWARCLDPWSWSGVQTMESIPDGASLISCYLPNDAPGTTSMLAKIDSSGNILWHHYFDQIVFSGLPGSPGIIVQPDRGCILGVWSFSFASEGGLMKIDSQGIWQSSLKFHADSGKDHPVVKSLLQLADGGIVCALATWWNDSLHSELVKLTTDGKIMWERQLVPDAESELYSLAKTSDGGFVVCGNVTAKKSRISGTLIEKFDPSGNLLWGTTINTVTGNRAYSITEASNGDIISAGERNSQAAFIRLNSTGTVVSIKTLSLPNLSTTAYSIFQSQDRGYVVGGDISYKTRDSSKILMIKLDSNLEDCNINDNLYTTQTEASTTDSITFSVSFENINDSSYSNILKFEIPVSETDLCSISSVAPPNYKEINFSIFPNPLNSQDPLTISIEGLFPAGIYTISLRDLLGKEIKYQKINLTGERQNIIFDMHEYVTGIYFIELQNENGVVARAKVVKE